MCCTMTSFDPADIDHNMHDRPVRDVMDEMDVHDMPVEVKGDSKQDVNSLLTSSNARWRLCCGNYWLTNVFRAAST